MIMNPVLLSAYFWTGGFDCQAENFYKYLNLFELTDMIYINVCICL